jgi:hypothetical protein
MDTKLVKTIAMYGPSISDPSKVVNRDVPVADIQAYKAAGYVVGSIVEEVETVEVPVEVPRKKRGK